MMTEYFVYLAIISVHNFNVIHAPSPLQKKKKYNGENKYLTMDIEMSLI